ncbi:hypothetical protein PPSIR1_20789 [Plesiocystis pacifica SIR-1]|uniref:Gingipain domain-containing protein n=1 Tax=Plesiocystis pacifica SIR-1 TaxID=391625 RepID=A6GGS3_9BACT|nr:hypothetical protein [Plesiocystis pacifica]EDM74920.1 hypothetical protein PPSIR1_20789 [Plesiocystis pacifica SIR-1]
MTIQDLDEPVHFNGINASSGDYLFDSVSTAELAQVAEGRTLARADDDDQKSHLAELADKKRQKDNRHFGVKEGVDASKLEESGWAVLFPATGRDAEAKRAQDAIREALSPLLALRRAQATKLHAHRYREYRGADGYRPKESKVQLLARLGAGPGPVDPDKIPYYILIVASPDEIPFRVQYQLDVQYAVGRIHFDTLDNYANYARSVVAAETGGLALPREAAFVGVSNPDDAATQLSREFLVSPLADKTEAWKGPDGAQWSVSRYFDERADKATVSQLFGGPSTPALMFTGSHGVGFELGDPRQRRHQGALLLQDWPGPNHWKGPIKEELYLSGDDLSGGAGMLGMIAFNFACYGGGTPRYDEFAKQAFKERKPIAEAPFLSDLQRRMLAHPKGGALAAVGHIERAWGYSFMWGTGKRGASEPALAVFESALEVLMKGATVGMAIEYFNERYAEMASDLTLQIEELEWDPDAVDPFTLAHTWTSNNDARGYAVMGDPAVRLSLAPLDGEPRGRDSVVLGQLPAPSSESSPESSPATTGEAPTAGEPDEAPSAQAPGPEAGNVNFGWFGKGKEDEGEGRPAANPESGEDEQPPPAPHESRGTISGFVNRMAEALSGAVEDAMTLEVRTYVSADPSAAASVDRKTLAEQGDLRAFTRIRIDGDLDVVVPQRDGGIDKELWELHLQMVQQAQETRAQTIQTVLTALGNLTKL